MDDRIAGNAHNAYINALAEKWADRICWRYASEGAATALPGAIPGLGTAAQIGIEAGAISADLAYMLRCMAGMTIGVGALVSGGFNLATMKGFKQAAIDYYRTDGIVLFEE